MSAYEEARKDAGQSHRGISTQPNGRLDRIGVRLAASAELLDRLERDLTAEVNRLTGPIPTEATGKDIARNTPADSIGKLELIAEAIEFQVNKIGSVALQRIKEI